VSGEICAQNLPSEASFKLLRANSDPEMPWMPFIFGQTFSSIWYWCTDQVIVQRSLSAKNLAHSQGGSILAGLLKFLPAMIMVFPGMLARIIFPEILGCAAGDDCFEQCGEYASCANHAFPLVVLNILPSGVRGLMFSVVIAALMSGLDSIFNSASTLFTIDIWLKFRPDSSEKELIFTGRIVVIVVAVLSILWVSLFNFLEKMKGDEKITVFYSRVRELTSRDTCMK
jgi:sodium/myo-inositol cotransporter 3